MCPIAHLSGSRKKHKTKNDSCVNDMDAFCCKYSHLHPDILKQDVLRGTLTTRYRDIPCESIPKQKKRRG